MKIRLTLVFVACLALLSACGQKAEDGATGTEAASAVAKKAAKAAKAAPGSMVLPATTSSDAALELYMAGWADYENSRNVSANRKFLAAAEADPSFAMAHLMAAATSASTEGFVMNLGRASESKEDATPGEQLIVESFERLLASDAQGAIVATRQVTELHPDSPRAWVFLGGAYQNISNSADARAAFAKAIELDPGHVPGHINLGNDYLTQEPKDFAKAEEHFKHAIELTPREPNPWDLLGDVHRAQGNLEAAYDDYTKAAELAPDLGSGLQQRGHVNSFLGNYDEARADYTRAAVLEEKRGSNAGPGFQVFRAYVNLHEGNHDAAIAELQEIADEMDGASMDGAMDLRIGALLNVALIAIEDGNGDVAAAAISDAAATMRRQAADVGSDDIRDGAEATISYFEGMLAARNGDAKGAAAKAAEFEGHVASSTNPRKLERMHEILGMAAYHKGDFAGAVQHLAEGNHVNNMYIKYYFARANEAAGNAAEAARLYSELAVYNFNGPGYAMFRKDILARAGG